MNAMDEVFAEIERSFRFLELEFGLGRDRVIRKRDRIEFRYSNGRTGVIVSYEPRDAFVFVMLCRLLDGKFQRNPGEIRPDSELHCFDQNDLVQLHAPNEVVRGYVLGQHRPCYGLKGIIKGQAGNLWQYGRDVLEGDFSVFSDLDRIVKARAREFAVNKWGKRARDFGWELD